MTFKGFEVSGSRGRLPKGGVQRLPTDLGPVVGRGRGGVREALTRLDDPEGVGG